MTTHSPESNYTATKPTSLWHKCTCARCVHVWAVVIETVIVAGISKCLYFFSPSQSLPSLATPRLLTHIIVCRLVQGAKKCGRVGWQGRAHACVCSTLFYYSLHHDHHPCNTHLPPLRLALLRPRSQSRRPSSVVRRPVVPSSVPPAASSSYICCNCPTYALRSLLFFFHSRLVVRASYFPIRQNSGMKVTTESVSCKRYKMNSAFIPISHLVSLPLVSHIPVPSRRHSSLKTRNLKIPKNYSQLKSNRYLKFSIYRVL